LQIIFMSIFSVAIGFYLCWKLTIVIVTFNILLMLAGRFLADAASEAQVRAEAHGQNSRNFFYYRTRVWVNMLPQEVLLTKHSIRSVLSQFSTLNLISYPRMDDMLRKR
jgi:hypothetical protein